MEQATTYTAGTRVSYREIEEAEVIGYKSGWYTIELDSGETLKARATDIELLDSQESNEESEQNEDEEEQDEATLSAAAKMAQALRTARVHYRKTKTSLGVASADCGDLIAQELHYYETPKEVAELADLVLAVPTGTHFAKYGHLNNGQIRMNSGNRIRAAYNNSKAAAFAPEATLAEEQDYERIAKLLGLYDEEAEEDAISDLH
jgi:hypothetical protein